MSFLEKISPIPLGFHIIDMTNNEEYEINDEKLDRKSEDATERTLAEHLEEMDERNKAKKTSKVTSKEGKSKFKDSTKVTKDQLNLEEVRNTPEEKGIDKERVDD